MNDIVDKLNSIALLDSLHEVSFMLHELAPLIKSRGLVFEIMQVQTFADNAEWDEVLTKKVIAIAKEDFSAAAELRKEEKRILSAKVQECKQINQELRPRFEIEDYIIKAYLPHQNRMSKLLKQLIKDYNLEA